MFTGASGGDVILGWNGFVAGWSRLHGGHDLRSASPAVLCWLRVGYRIASLVSRSSMKPNALTALGLACSAGVPVVAGWRGPWPMLSAFLVVAAAIADTVDGALAVISRRVSRLGHVYDALVDRISEACWLVAFFLLGAACWLVALCGALTWLHEYVRARGALAGAPESGALALGEQPTRVVIAATALIFSGAGGFVSPEFAVGTVTAAGAIWMMLQAIAFLQLLAVTHRSLVELPRIH